VIGALAIFLSIFLFAEIVHIIIRPKAKSNSFHLRVERVSLVSSAQHPRYQSALIQLLVALNFLVIVIAFLALLAPKYGLEFNLRNLPFFSGLASLIAGVWWIFKKGIAN